MQESAEAVVGELEEGLARDFGAIIRRERVRRHLSQEEFAAELGVSARSVENWESGRMLPRPATRRLLIRLYPRLGEVWEEAYSDEAGR